jgi:hypothetical protein
MSSRDLKEQGELFGVAGKILGIAGKVAQNCGIANGWHGFVGAQWMAPGPKFAETTSGLVLA